MQALFAVDGRDGFWEELAERCRDECIIGRRGRWLARLAARDSRRNAVDDVVEEGRGHGVEAPEGKEGCGCGVSGIVLSR